MTAFDAALKELEDRGLLQWDRDSNRYEMHPVVRAYAAESLDTDDRIATFDKVRDHFASLPPDDLTTATELTHIAQTLEIYRCLIGAGKLDEAATFYRGDLSYTLYFHLGAYAIVLELLRPLFGDDLNGLPCLNSSRMQSYILNDLANAYGETGREEAALAVCGRALQLELEEQNWWEVVTRLINLRISYVALNHRAAGVTAIGLARDQAEAADEENSLTVAILQHMKEAVDQGRFADSESLHSEFRNRPQPPINLYRPGDAEIRYCLSKYFQGRLNETEWKTAFDIAVQHRNIIIQYEFLAMRAAWDMWEGRPARALEWIDKALQITNKMGSPKPGYHDLRAWVLAALNRPADARVELQSGEQRLFAAKAHRLLGEIDQARTCALNAYRHAWGEGPPYILWFQLERSRKLLQELGEPVPQLPPFDPTKVEPIPFEKEIREAIAKLNAEKADATKR